MIPGTTVKADAMERGWRTFMQGLGVDVAVAIAAALMLWLPESNVADPVAWSILATSVIKSVLTAVASYVMRLKVPPQENAAQLF